MLALLSPSKDLYDPVPISKFEVHCSIPRLWSKSWHIVEALKKKSVADLKKLMGINDKLAALNFARNQAFSKIFTEANSRPAVYTFSGDVYRGLDAWSLTRDQVDYCEAHVRILSGLYGVLRPLDLMQPYRLEMGTELPVKTCKNLYDFWKRDITKLIVQDIETSRSTCLINLASQEYFSALDTRKVKVPIIHIHFREYKNGKWKFVSFTAKRARGLMVRFMAQHKIADVDQLKAFDFEQYRFEDKLSSENDYYFIR